VVRKSLAACSSPCPEAHADIADVELSVFDKGTSSAQTARVTVSLVENQSASNVTAQLADGLYNISVRQEAHKNRSTVFLQVEGIGTADLGIRKLSATARPAAGKRIVLASLTKPDGSRFEIALTMR